METLCWLHGLAPLASYPEGKIVSSLYETSLETVIDIWGRIKKTCNELVLNTHISYTVNCLLGEDYEINSSGNFLEM